MKEQITMNFLKRLAKGLAKQFGEDCEIAIHDLTTENKESTVVAIENGHVTNRVVGDGPSEVVLEALKRNKPMEDHLNYRTKTQDGRILRSSTIYIKNDKEEVTGVFSINYDITRLVMAENAIKTLTISNQEVDNAPSKITRNVGDLLDELIEKSVKLVGKPVAMMSKEDKIRAMEFLNESGAFLITKSGDKVSEYFGISKYTLYNYINVKSQLS